LVRTILESFLIYYLQRKDTFTIISINGINESFKKDNTRKTSATNIENKKANPKPLIQTQSVLQSALKALWCFCCAVTTLIRLGRKTAAVYRRFGTRHRSHLQGSKSPERRQFIS